MSVTTTTEIKGIREAVTSLNKIQPGLRKEFTAELNQIAAPALDVARNEYGSLGLPLSGMGKIWTQNDRKLFPYSVAKAQKGVKIKLDTRRDALSVIMIMQTDQAASIYETAGRAKSSKLATNLGNTPKSGRTRLFGPAVYTKIRDITEAIEQAALRVIDQVKKEFV